MMKNRSISIALAMALLGVFVIFFMAGMKIYEDFLEDEII